MLEALAGAEHVSLTFAAALRERYRWHEFGDRHLILVKGRVAFSGTTAEFLASAEQNLSLLRA